MKWKSTNNDLQQMTLMFRQTRKMSGEEAIAVSLRHLSVLACLSLLSAFLPASAALPAAGNCLLVRNGHGIGAILVGRESSPFYRY